MEPLYKKEHQVSLKGLDREDNKVPIGIAVEYQYTSLSRKELVIRLTNEKDLCFLYSKRINEEDFQILKSEQGLLVDFHGFSQRLIGLLSLCHAEEDKENPKYILKFVTQMDQDIEVWTLNIIETNPFKHLTHLALKMIPGDDSEVKKFLAQSLKTTKEENHNLIIQLEKTETSLTKKVNDLQKALSEKTVELEHWRNEWQEKHRELSTKLSEQLRIEKERSTESQTLSQQRYDRDKRELEQAHLKIVKQLEEKSYELDTSNKLLTEENLKLESQLRDYKSRVESLQEDYQKSREEVASLRRQLDSRDREHYELESLKHKQDTRIAVLEQELADKEQLLSKTQDLYTAEQEHKQRCQDEVKRKVKQIEKLERNVKGLSDEVNKGNEIIKKLQSDIRNYHSKNKMCSQIAIEQEKVLAEKEKELSVVKSELSDLKTKHTTKEQEVNKLNAELESNTKHLEEARQIIKTNENVINWLNRQITESQMNKHKLFQSHYPASSTTTGATTSIPASHPTSSQGHYPSSTSDNSLQYKPNLPTVTVSRRGDQVSNSQPITSHDTVSNHRPVPSSSSTATINPSVVTAGLDLKYLRHSETAPSPIQPVNTFTPYNGGGGVPHSIITSTTNKQAANIMHQSLTSAYFSKSNAAAAPVVNGQNK